MMQSLSTQRSFFRELLSTAKTKSWLPQNPPIFLAVKPLRRLSYCLIKPPTCIYPKLFPQIVAHLRDFQTNVFIVGT